MALVQTGPSPKQRQPERLKTWYPYYAGFTEDFVESVLQTHLKGITSCLDPWNGSGTTTSVCTARGIPSTGLDVNPAATLIARARLLPFAVDDSVGPIALELVRAAENPKPRRYEPLATWLRAPTIDRLRGIQQQIHAILAGPGFETDADATAPAALAEHLPVLAAFFYTALFGTARDLLRPFRGSNPTWHRTPKTYRHRMNPSKEVVDALFLSRVRFLAERLRVNARSQSVATRISTDSVLDITGIGQYDA